MQTDRLLLNVGMQRFSQLIVRVDCWKAGCVCVLRSCTPQYSGSDLTATNGAWDYIGCHYYTDNFTYLGTEHYADSVDDCVTDCAGSAEFVLQYGESLMTTNTIILFSLFLFFFLPRWP